MAYRIEITGTHRAGKTTLIEALTSPNALATVNYSCPKANKVESFRAAGRDLAQLLRPSLLAAVLSLRRSPWAHLAVQLLQDYAFARRQLRRPSSAELTIVEGGFASRLCRRAGDASVGVPAAAFEPVVPHLAGLVASSFDGWLHVEAPEEVVVERADLAGGKPGLDAREWYRGQSRMLGLVADELERRGFPVVRVDGVENDPVAVRAALDQLRARPPRRKRNEAFRRRATTRLDTPTELTKP